ncbi:MAG: ATP-dependent protease [SAR202 cluster bacterium]|nr:ATP-dependent protease [SAR202 cluster bacterium]|tara:strand:+ start:3504 stop:5927 length:2424 start_codon:yes stop_codon:yes gene_type:complete
MILAPKKLNWRLDLSELSIESLRCVYDPNAFQFDNTSELTDLQGIIGQERAVQSLEFGLDIDSDGFNIYAAGAPGTGKTTAITSFVQNRAKTKDNPSDWCYVQNFDDPRYPRLLAVPSGIGNALKDDISKLVEESSVNIIRALENDEYNAKVEEIINIGNTKKQELLNEISNNAQNYDFILQSSPTGLRLIPSKNGVPLSEEEINNLTPEQNDQLGKNHVIIEKQLKEVLGEIRAIDRIKLEEIQNLDFEIANYSLNPVIDELKQKYSSLDQVHSYLDEVRKDIVRNISTFKSSTEDGPDGTPQNASRTRIRQYQLNMIVDNSDSDGAPVVMETNPTLKNLLGYVERESHMGTLSTDFTMIRAGSMHRANGGYLIIRVEDILSNNSNWDGIKRCLKEKVIAIDDSPETQGLITNTLTINPQPIPLDVKIILIGDPGIYQALYSKDPDFTELFKVKVEFDNSMERTGKNISDYASFVSTLCRKEKLLHMSKTGVAKIIEHSSRMVEDQTRLSTQFAEISDIIRESNHWAKLASFDYIQSEHVDKAVENKSYRSGLIKDKILDMIHHGTISIDTTNQVAGQINGLSVMNLGEISFGKPNKITVSIGTGREGFIDIERESLLGGRLHSKGVMILAGYLTDKMSMNIPLSLVARLAFEQSYNEVDGDSASSTELYAILSALSELPINQGLAVTGSVNQKGQIQPIGGINHKIEGFFEVCKAQGLNGTQGVLIPHSNTKHLMLKTEIIESVKKGEFHIYSVETIDQGIEILTGVKAGLKKPNGRFDDGSVNLMVYEKLLMLGSNLRKFINPG